MLRIASKLLPSRCQITRLRLHRSMTQPFVMEDATTGTSLEGSSGEAMMTDASKLQVPGSGAEPPGGGKQDHDTMRAASSFPVSGPAEADTLAASGGLDVPGREPHPIGPDAHAASHEMIPGERDAGTLTFREPGAIGGQFNGADLPQTPIDAMLDDDTIHDHEIEGGGDAVKHRREQHGR
jgi:hypothetical protein